MNNPLISRRQTLLAGTGFAFLHASLSHAASPQASVARSASFPALAALERRAGGRLGVCALDLRSGERIGHRQHERFGLCSSFKLPLAAMVLREADAGRLQLDQWLAFGKADLVHHAPVARQHLAAGGMSVVALAEATQTTSDNVAANLLLKRLGGPAGLTAMLRQVGDTETRIDRFEPAMNVVRPGELRDTTTPQAIARLCADLLSGEVLKPESRQRLLSWAQATETGLERLRAGFPTGWLAGDKTGTFTSPDMASKINDVAITWPADSTPQRGLVVSAYYEAPKPWGGPLRDRDLAVLAEAGRIAAAWWQSQPPLAAAQAR
ncbi:class A beta-lactamase [Paucibacter sp. DJ2R-2]|uniref:class A beta-lactamase n=1 Tax=Paucibacter sp. DJ2R-2 TaxID=2893558 RepID=UPI0021E49167|nr:class A beta-lactamase [Paucibacter sp. DJ2R-2]MCV2419871.1 class A beta-lactamase [Paucibacter sp. DJ4R-1]MCV2437226.1 class A beta-lactamase [Paucibacter sp. DJ2R-2]